MNHLVCRRCGGNPGNGVSMNLNGPATGYNTESLVLCDDCVRGFRDYLAGKFAFLPDDLPADLDHELPEPRIISKQRVAERFARKGLAQ